MGSSFKEVLVGVLTKDERIRTKVIKIKDRSMMILRVFLIFQLFYLTNALNVLCLHSFGSSGRLMRVHLRRIIQECECSEMNFNFLFPNAPYRLSQTSKSYSWWNENDRTSYLDHIASFLKENEINKIDAIVGHSQGGAAGINILLQQRPDICAVYPKNTDDLLSLCVLYGSFPPREAAIDIKEEVNDGDTTIVNSISINNYDGKFKIPSIHVIGDNDDVVLPIYSKAAASMFSNSHILRHNGGHDIPTCDDTTQAIVIALKNAEKNRINQIENIKSNSNLSV